MADADAGAPKARPAAWEVLGGLVLVVVAVAALWWVGESDPARPGVVALEIAGDADTAKDLLEGTGTGTIDALRTGLQRDWLLIVAYVAALGWWCWYGRVHLRTRRLRRLAQVLTGAVVVAGVADVVENVALGRLLDAGGDNDAAAVVATAAAIPKWMILAVVVPVAAAVMVTAIARLGRRWVPAGWLRRPVFPDHGPAGEGPATPAPRGGLTDGFARHALSATPKVSGPEGPLGVCFSGGGIRSATFNMGVLQVLSCSEAPAPLVDPEVRERPTFLRSAAWLSCVSGGAYIAGALQMLSRDAEGKDLAPSPVPTFAPGSSEERFLRHHGRYLADTAPEWIGAFARVLAGVALNVLVFTLILFVVGRPLGWVQHDLFHVTEPDDMRTTGAMWAAVAWTGGGAILLYLVGTLVGGVDGAWRQRLERTALGFFLLGAAVLATVWLLPLLARWAPDVVTAIGQMLPGVSDPAGNESGATVLVVTGAGSLSGTALAIINRPTPAPERDAKPRFPSLSKVWGWFIRALPYIAGLLLGGLALLALALFAGQAARQGIHGTDTIFGIDGRREIAAFAAAAVVLALIYLTGDQTRWSLAPFYKRRLALAFALRRRPGGGTEERPWSQGTTLSTFTSVHPELPELLLCAAANVSDPESAPPGRRAQSFVFGTEWVGGPEIGWARTLDFEAVLRGPSASDGTMLGAMAISGAAFASAMGRHSKGAINGLLAASNARLGVWLPSPRYVEELRGRRREPPYERDGEAGVAVPYPGPWVGYRRLPYLFKELFGTYTGDDRFLYLTDGGHYENLGLVELFRRRCRMILCFDASGDDLMSCGTFVEALTLAREELGVEVDIDISPLAPNATGARPPGILTQLDTRLSTQSVVVGDVTYPEGLTGRLVLAKASLTVTTPTTVLAHAARQAKKTFPNDSTGDQFFDHTQFDAYAALGHHIATEAVAAV